MDIALGASPAIALTGIDQLAPLVGAAGFIGKPLRPWANEVGLLGIAP